MFLYLLDVDPGGNVKGVPKDTGLGALAAAATASIGLFRTGIVGTPRKEKKGDKKNANIYFLPSPPLAKIQVLFVYLNPFITK